MNQENICLLADHEAIKMRRVGKLNAILLLHLKNFIKEDNSTLDLNLEAEKWTSFNGALSAPLNYSIEQNLSFPKSICTSKNEIICHGIPCANEMLKNGDILNIDITLKYDDFHGDSSKTFPVGLITRKHYHLLKTTKSCLNLGILEATPGALTKNIGISRHNYITKFNCSVVKNFVGHGIGKFFHMQPFIFHYPNKHSKITLIPGMAFTIEPMINLGTEKVLPLQNGWSFKTKDNEFSAQFEHTLLITSSGTEILTII